MRRIDQLSRALGAIAPAGVSIAAGTIDIDDSQHLHEDERRAFDGANAARLAAGGAVRVLARELLSVHGVEAPVIGRTHFGAPIWPKGMVGSLAHDETTAVAAIARADRIALLGIDAEPAEPLPEEVWDLVLDPRDRWRDALFKAPDRIAFCVKEAVYKAVHPVIGRVLDYDDIRVDLPSLAAWTASGHRLSLRVHESTEIVVIAFAEAEVSGR